MGHHVEYGVAGHDALARIGRNIVPLAYAEVTVYLQMHVYLDMVTQAAGAQVVYALYAGGLQ